MTEKGVDKDKSQITVFKLPNLNHLVPYPIMEICYIGGTSNERVCKIFATCA